MGAGAPTRISARHSQQRVQLPELVVRPALVRSRCNGSSSLEHDSPAEPRMVAGAAELVENGRRATDVAFEHRATLLGPGGRYFYKVLVCAGAHPLLLAELNEDIK